MYEREKAQLFISFSGGRSKIVAEAFRRLLPTFFPNGINIFISTEMESGSRWLSAVFDTLESSTFAIVCLTPDNVMSPWLHFEAGAIGKSSESRVCTYLLGVHPDDVKGPLCAFNHTVADRENTYKLVRQIQASLAAENVDLGVLNKLFEGAWQEFDGELTKACEWQAAPHDSVEAFWAPHRRQIVRNKAPKLRGETHRPQTRLFYTEPRFWRYKRLFFRALDDNGDCQWQTGNSKERPREDFLPEELKAGVRRLDFNCVHQFVSAGETTCLIRLSELLTSFGVRIKHNVSHNRTSWADLRRYDTVVIGNARTHWAVRELQRDLPLDIQINQREIRIRNRRQPERPFYKDDDPGSNNRRVYAVITRCPAKESGHTITMLAANNGRAFEAVGNYVCDEELLGNLFKSVLTPPETLPRTFQLLLAVDLQHNDTGVSDKPELITTRPWGPIGRHVGD